MDICSVTEVCSGFLIRPSFLQHLLDKQSKDATQTVSATEVVSASLSRHLLQQQSSVEESDTCTPQLLHMQHRLLGLVSRCLLALRHFCPDLHDLLLCQSFDVSPYYSFVAIGFVAPSVDRQNRNLTFGTFIAIINLTLRLMIRMDGGRLSLSPQKTPTSAAVAKPFACENLPFKRPTVMFVMENALMLTMTEVMRCIRDPNLSQRDKQLLKRELGAELHELVLIRSTATSPQCVLHDSSKSSAGPRVSLQVHVILTVLTRARLLQNGQHVRQTSSALTQPSSSHRPLQQQLLSNCTCP